MLQVMDKNEVITLSSDDECDFTQELEKRPAITVKKLTSAEIIKACFGKIKETNVKSNSVICSTKEVEIFKLSKVPSEKPKLSSKESPEVVDLEDCSEKPDEEPQVQVNCVNKVAVNIPQNSYSQEIIEIEEVPNDSHHDSEQINTEINTVKPHTDSPTEINKPKLQDVPTSNLNCTKTLELQNETLKSIPNEGSDQNLKFFTEFVEHCGCLEENPNDRAKLTTKLMKRYGEANCHYVKSQEFRQLVEKCRLKVNKNNLYLVAKEVTDELIYKKKLDTGKTSIPEEKCQSEEIAVVEDEKTVESGDRRTKKRTKLINKIIKKLDKLGSKIRELEEKEVDLSDEEESSYVQLQRYRERFCQIYTKLCKYTNDVADADRVYNRKICFTESKYPAINKCIENWLNKTKRFPDFTDIMKLLESQSSALGLPSNKESIRAIASEIFQQVGVMLQRRRKYDLWDSFCGFLDEGEDPAQNDPLLDQILKNNYETRVKKEQEIFQHYVELQERDRLEPEEVPDEEANRSPVDSGNEEEKEIEEIENSLNHRLDDEINKDTEESGGNTKSNGTDEKHSEVLIKESKNNYKNCKSLKWRTENSKRDSENAEKEREEEGKAETNGDEENEKNDSGKPEEEKNNPDISESKVEIHSKVITEWVDSPSKRKRVAENEDSTPMKKKCKSDDVGDIFEVNYCQIFTDNAFEDFDSEKEKDWGKRKVFRDLTNVNRLMELHGRKKKVSGLFSPSFFHRSFCEFEKPSWKKRFKVSFRLVGSKGQKYALSQEDKSGKTVNSDSGADSDEKDIQNNSEGGDDEGDNFYNGRGNGSEEDNNGDENKKNGKPDEEISENQHEEDDDEEEEEEEEEKEQEKEKETEENDNKTKKTEHSFPNEKTEETTGTNGGNHDDSTATKESTAEKETEEIQSDTTQSEDNTECKITETLKEVEPCVGGGESDDDTVVSDEEKSNPETQTDDRGIEDSEESKKVEEVCVESVEKRDEETKENGSKDEAEENEVEKQSLEEGGKEEINDIIENKEEINDAMENKQGKEEINDIIENKEEINDAMENKEEINDAMENKEEINDAMENKEEKDVTIEKKEGKEEVNDTIEKKEGKEEINDTIENKEEKEKINDKMENKEIKDEVPVEVSIVVDESTPEIKNNRNTIEPTIKPFNPKYKYRNPLTKTNSTPTTRENGRRKRPPHEPIRNPFRTDAKPLPKKPSTSDEEIVKRFLLHSPSSISITPPKKLSLSKPPSQAAIQALATLRNLKDISATIVKGGSKPKPEDDVVVIGGSYRRPTEQKPSNPNKRKRADIPVISNVQSMDATTPKIVTVQGNVSGFDNTWPGVSNSAQCNSNSIRISNVWGNFPNNFMQSMQNDTPGCSFQQQNNTPTRNSKKKPVKKTVEYVVLD